jgi:hypothetical protein
MWGGEAALQLPPRLPLVYPVALILGRDQQITTRAREREEGGLCAAPVVWLCVRVRAEYSDASNNANIRTRPGNEVRREGDAGGSRRASRLSQSCAAVAAQPEAL